MKTVEKSIEIGNRKLTLQYGKVAKFANAALIGTYGETVVLATVVASKKETTLDYFPLQVEYAEKLYAGGRIKGSRWVKREGRPSDEAILSARLTDRSIRPLFPKNFKKDVQVIVTVLSVDKENDPDILGMISVSAALAISDIPWNGPIGAVRIGYIEKNLIINPPQTEMNFSDLDLVVSGSDEKVVMLEAGANQVSNEVFFSAVKMANTEIKRITSFIDEFVKEVGKTKQIVIADQTEDLKKAIAKKYDKEIKQLVEDASKKERIDDVLFDLGNKIVLAEANKDYELKKVVEALRSLSFKHIRENILKNGKRVDGRGVEEIRSISGEVSVLPRTHGSAIFQRGDTQVLTITTLAAPSLEQWLETAEGEETKRYMHHYFMPPYSVGETGRFGFPSRREVGHGALAERALMPVIPTQEQFPYTIRVVSEVLSSNGSTSMASSCGSTLSLMDAGVPIKEPVAGISIGLVTDEKDPYNKYVLLTDIAGIEDFSGDMDFKVAGTKNGITAVQLDVKLPGLSEKMVEETLEKALTARLSILEKMLSVLPQSRVNISKFAPKIEVIKLPQDKIGEVIGPGGKIIRQIIAETECDLNVDDNGVLTIAGTDETKVEKAANWVKNIIREIKVEEVFEGEVKRIATFGAFVEIVPGKEGLVHVSQMRKDFVKDPEEVVKLGQKVKVRVIEVDDQGRIRLSMLFGEDMKKDEGRPAPSHREHGFSRDRNRRRPTGGRYSHPHLKDYR